jgi:aminopeptidase
MASSYAPAKIYLKKYAQVLIDFALGESARGVKKGETVLLQYDQPAVELALLVYQRILERGANAIVNQNDTDFAKIFFSQSCSLQRRFFPKHYYRGLVKDIDHKVYLIADKDPLYLKNIEPQKIIEAIVAKKPLGDALRRKEDEGKLTWTLALYGTEKMAAEAGLSLPQYWQQIIKACFLNEAKPINKWQKVTGEITKIIAKLNKLPITKLRVKAKNTDLTYSLGKDRAWMGGSGRNIPSFEIFTSPDWRGTNGHIYFDLPLYRYGSLIEGVYLQFKNGRVEKAAAQKNENLLRAIIKQKNADKVGEFSLTDKRFSRIDKFMANTLYDENFGGKYGNTHLALGASYHDCYRKEVRHLKKKDWQKLGYNDSTEHMDIIAKQDRVVEATLVNGQIITIYRAGTFVFS